MLSSSALHTLGSGLLAASSLHCSPGVFSFDIPMDSHWHYQFRIIMLGDSTVGKSSLLKRYTEGVFLESINQTVGVDFYVQFMEIEPGVQVKLQFWDTAGQERFRSVTRSYYRNSAGGVLMFDLTNRASFESIREWHREVTETVKPFHIVFVLVGHKCDLIAERKVGKKEGEKLASSLGAKYIETSAKNSSNVDAAFQMLTMGIYEALKTGVMSPNEDWDGVKSRLSPKVVTTVQTPGKQEQKKKCTC
ncbi:ras-related protein Rab-39B-like [Alligator sinensis]|uniref:Ras-related protein Rab-39B-like n=1 Tax=Alligator sinensis TaxID=38654 RepID=A0A1U7RDX5_ALLSI|nr:ras-related protein Rab-39B-like [Alligator sinensis]